MLFRFWLVMSEIYLSTLVQFENTPKALANVSPGFEEREPWGTIYNNDGTLKGLGDWRTPSGFELLLCYGPRVLVPRTLG